MPVNMRSFVGPGGSTLGSFDNTLSKTRAVVPTELASALNRWRALEQTPRPARPDMKTTITLAGEEIAAAVPDPDTKLDVAVLLPDRRADALLAAHNRADLRAQAFEAAKQAAVRNVLRVLNRVSDDLTASLQARYLALSKTMFSAARALPADFDHKSATYATEELAKHWRSAVAAHDEQQSIRSLVVELDTPGPLDPDVRDLMFVRSTLGRQNRDRFGHYRFGNPGELLGALTLARMVEKADVLWCPIWKQAADAAAELFPPAKTVARVGW